MAKAIWFDMDGTIADLYGVRGWLEMLNNQDETPYAVARPLLRLQTLARMLNKLQRNGYKVGVVSWLSRNATEDYNRRVAQAKRDWLARHLPSVCFDSIDIVPYGTPKQEGREGILFDDEERNRAMWCGQAYDVQNIIEVLRGLR